MLRLTIRPPLLKVAAVAILTNLQQAVDTAPMPQDQVSKAPSQVMTVLSVWLARAAHLDLYAAGYPIPQHSPGVVWCGSEQPVPTYAEYPPSPHLHTLSYYV